MLLVNVSTAQQVEVRVADDFELHTSRKSYVLAVNGQELEVLPASPPAAGAVTWETAAAQATACSPSGPQNIAVLLVNFPGTRLPAHVTPSFVESAFFNSSHSIDTYWREASYNRMTAAGQVFGPFTLGADFTCNDVGAIRDAAIAAAGSVADLRNFSRIFIIMPPAGRCPIGVATLGCGPISSAKGTFTASTSWLRADYLTDADHLISVGAHEGGHNLGLDHASTLDHGAQPLAAPGVGGTYREYWDVYSAMGLNFGVGRTMLIGHYAAPHKTALGWLDNGADYRTVTSSGVFTLAPYESAAPGLKALKIQRPGSNKWLWVEYRQPAGQWDTALGLYGSNLYSGALIHYEDPDDAAHTGQSVLLDFTPLADPNDFSDAALVSGRAWNDPDSGLAISIGGATSSELQVSVTFPPSACDLNGDGVVDGADVQLAINRVLGLIDCGKGDLDGSGRCDAGDLQRVVTAAAGGSCRTGQ
ncbi:MAG: hypothetical protein HY013_19460 [Candidatus Solibacter usitatus]|nr:hypothetical protein [Candidatus Solibacter usitatus]